MLILVPLKLKVSELNQAYPWRNWQTLWTSEQEKLTPKKLAHSVKSGQTLCKCFDIFGLLAVWWPVVWWSSSVVGSSAEQCSRKWLLPPRGSTQGTTRSPKDSGNLLHDQYVCVMCGRSEIFSAHSKSNSISFRESETQSVTWLHCWFILNIIMKGSHRN